MGSASYFAISLLIIGNLAASLSDVAVKLLNGEVSSFQYIFIRQFLSTLVIAPFWWKQQQEKRRLLNIKLNLLRAHLIIIGSGCMVVAITHLTLATANAVFYAAPLLMLPLSVLLLNEKPSIGRVTASIFGFIGVIVVLRPSEFHWAALFALGTTLTLALFNVTARKLPTQQTVVSTLFWTSLLSIPVSAIVALINWNPISFHQVGLILASAALILAYNGFAVAAYKRAPASNIAIAENSGLVFVVIIGVVWFSEVPDWLTTLGIIMIVLPLMPWRVITCKASYLLRPKPPSERRKNITD
ncbi:DMT family transporter [Vibrio aquaticus]|uniref:DMT family transporter n=1 Tax=Vibrio aquaticus TaxID=2496559 RepID=A0A432CTT3_9VIBR|nr:DMT family transporter [Vibrio aquaticus]RTZ14769.1 DMT family transporter [Vibrio aquaticus]